MLTYPLEMYYPNCDFGIPTIEEQLFIINEYKNYIHNCNQYDIKIDDKHITVKAMKFLLERQKQKSYFEGVREIINLIFSEIKTPDELFASMFPDRESLVYLFKQQFLDACELILADNVNWEKMNLNWYKYKKGYFNNEFKEEIKNKENELEELKNILNEQVSLLNKKGDVF